VNTVPDAQGQLIRCNLIWVILAPAARRYPRSVRSSAVDAAKAAVATHVIRITTHAIGAAAGLNHGATKCLNAHGTGRHARPRAIRDVPPVSSLKPVRRAAGVSSKNRGHR